MATGPEHYREAERLIESTGRMSWSSDAGRDVTLAAQVHAVLALAAVTADLFALTGQEGRASAQAWREALGNAQPQGGDTGE